MQSTKVTSTKNYKLFSRSGDNRPLDPKKHKRLKKSMEKYGYLPCYPIVCIRDKKQNLIVLDGQHRLYMAELLGLPVAYAVVDEAFDIATINGTQEKWNTRNFAETFAAQGKREYQEGIEFADRYGIAIGIAFGLLAGTANLSNVHEEYYGGTFHIRDKEWAEVVGNIYATIVGLSPRLRNTRLLEACMAVARTDNFDPQRLLGGAEKCRDKLVPYSTRDAYLDLLETIYNFGRQKLVSLKINAIQAMRDRSAVNKNGSAKK